MSGNHAPLSRRKLLRIGVDAVTLYGAFQVLGAHAVSAVTLPFENGERPLVHYPQKRALIRLTTRPPQLETPMSVFNEAVLTPNDAFFVRYHLTSSPVAIDPEMFRLEVKGKVNTPLTLTLEELKRFDASEIVAVN